MPALTLRLSQLFLEAARLEPGEMSRFLDTLPDPDRLLRPDLERLLEADRRNADGFLLSPPPVPAPAEQLPAAGLAGIPAPFAGFRPLSLIGESEHAAVYLAARDGPLDESTTVALKVMRAHSAAPRLLRRFEQERRIIALMDHPNVARFVASGAAPDGRAYLATEHVPGSAITTFAQGEALPVRDRLDLFCQACLGVEHAHQLGIIHRDLKPSNIIAARTPTGGLTVKVIDFGIAKAIGNVSFRGTLTSPGQFVGTVPYMSPEQVHADPRIDTRTDVYSMGAVLYELLTGRPLIDASDAGPVTVIDRILHVEAPRPSLLNRAAKGDLDTITGAALAKDPARRYPSVAALREDVERCLAGRPIVARPPSRAYIARKFVARHRVLVAVTLIAGAAMVLTAARAWQMQQRRFDLAVDMARSWFDEIRAMAKSADFRSGRGPLIKRLDGASAKLLERAPDSFGVLRLRADVLHAAGDYEQEERRPAEALARFQQALAIRERLAAESPRDPDLRTDLSVALVRCGDALRDLGRDNETLTLYQRAFALDQQTFTEAPQSPRAITVLGWSYDRLASFIVARQGPDAAIPLYRREQALFQDLVKVERSADAQRSLANAETHLGLIAVGTNPALGHEYLAQAIAHADEAVHVDPGDRLALGSRVGIRLDVLSIDSAKPITHEFQREADEALVLARELSSRDRADQLFRRHLVDALHFAGTAALYFDGPDPAFTLFDEEGLEVQQLLAHRPTAGEDLARRDRGIDDLQRIAEAPEPASPAQPEEKPVTP